MVVSCVCLRVEMVVCPSPPAAHSSTAIFTRLYTRVGTGREEPIRSWVKGQGHAAMTIKNLVNCRNR